MATVLHLFGLLAALGNLIVIVNSSVPPKLSHMAVPPELEAGGPLAIMCFAIRGTDPLTFSWTLNGQHISSNPHLSFDNQAKRSVLSIDSVKISDGGNYTCHVTNSHGTDSYSAILKITGNAYCKFLALSIS